MQSGGREKLLVEGKLNISLIIDEVDNKNYLFFQMHEKTQKIRIVSPGVGKMLGETAPADVIPMILIIYGLDWGWEHSRYFSWYNELKQSHFDTLSSLVTQHLATNQIKEEDSVSIDVNQQNLVNTFPSKEISADVNQENLVNGISIELLTFILSYLPLSNFGNVILVCRHWHTLMRDNLLWRFHLQSISYFGNEDPSENSDDNVFLYTQFSASIKYNIRPSRDSDLQRMLKAAIEGDLPTMLDQFIKIKNRATNNQAQLQATSQTDILVQFVKWLREVVYGDVIFYALCVFKHQKILDLFYLSEIIPDILLTLPGYEEALTNATRYNQVDKLNLILKYRGKIGTASFRRLLDVAVSWNHLDALTALLLNEVTEHNHPHHFFWPLHTACEKGHSKAVERLLDHDFHEEINQRSNDSALILSQQFNQGGRPLDYSIKNGRSHILQLLLLRGANSSAENFISIEDQEPLAQPRKSYPATRTFLENAVLKSDVECVKNYLKLGNFLGFANRRNEKGEYLLHLSKHPEITQMLINAGNEVNCRDNELKTPLHAAVRDGNVNVTRTLIANHADLNLKDKTGKKPIDYSIPKKEMYRLLRDSEYRKQLNEILDQHSSETNEKKIKILCQFYINKHNYFKLFTKPEKINICKEMIKLIEKNELTQETFSNCIRKFSGKPGFFTVLLDSIGELMKVKKQSITGTNTNLPNQEMKGEEPELKQPRAS